MADNTTLNVGTGGDVLKTEDIGTYKIAVAKIHTGAAGVDGGPVTTANPLGVSVGNFPATQPVSLASSVAVTGTFFPATQPVSLASAPLPTGAATSAKQAAIGTAGTPSVDVLTVQGAAGMTPFKVDGSAAIQPVGGSKVIVAVTFTRPADVIAYAVGDVVSNSTTATTPLDFASFARISGGSGYITGARLATNLKSITPIIRVHLFNAATASLAGDNLPWKELYADTSKRLGYFDLPAMTTGADTTNSDMSRSLDMSIRHIFVASGARNIYAVLETLSPFTPASGQSFTLTLCGDLD